MALATENSIQLDNSNCRICLFAKQNLCPLFRRGLSMKVMKLADIKMYEGDGLPSSICLDCEFEVKRCTNFVAQIQQADAKLREMLAEKEKEVNETCVNDKEIVEGLAEGEEQEASTSQIEIEEFNVKQEITSLDNFIDEKEDFHSDSDHDHFGGGLDNIDQPEDDDELNPLNHVDVVEDINRGDQMDIFTDPLGQEEPLIESHTTEIDPSTDPLTYMKQEAVAMDVDKNMPEVPGPSSSVEPSVVSLSCTPQSFNKTMDHLKTRALLVAGWKKLSIEQKLLTRKVTAESYILDTDHQSFSSLVGSKPRKISGNNKLNRNCVKPKKVNPRKTKNLLAPIKNSLEKKSPQILQKISENESFCVICNMNFSSYESFKEHREKRELICRVCTTEFANHNDLETHFHVHAIKCRLCRKTFYTYKEVKLHKSQMHIVKRLECKVCLKTCSTRYALHNHVKLFHGEAEDNCGCIVCGKTFKCSFQLKQHLAQSHTAYEHVECKFCHMFFIGPYKLQSHVKRIHLDSEENVPTSCSTCGKVFNRASLLAKHQDTHDNTESVCHICGKTIKTKSLMNSHMEMQHSKTGTFTCRTCNKQFSVKKELRMHQRSHHQRQLEPLFCSVCGKVFKNLNTLKSHKVTHADERPFKCEVCGATFKLGVTLKTHQRVHSNVGKYSCSGCGASFKWKQTYDKHLNKCNVVEGSS